MIGAINKRHRYLIKQNAGEKYVGSTDDLGDSDNLPLGHCLVDTIGEDGLGSVNGNLGIRDFLRAQEMGQKP